MFASLITTAATLAALQFVTLADPPRTRAIADDHLHTAQRAMNSGDFDIARREFSAAVAEDREAGRLPVESTMGLANALYAQAYNREAAITMEKLADEAALRGDNDTEAVALADAIWLNADAGQRLVARKLTDRLRLLLKETPLSNDARKMVRARLG